AKVIEKFRPGALDAGEIVHIDGTVMGQHDGIIHYTVGQRKGLGIAHHEPLYVIRIKADERQVVVGPREALGRDEMYIQQVNWLGDTGWPEDGTHVMVKIRSLHKGIMARLFSTDEEGW